MFIGGILPFFVASGWRSCFIHKLVIKTKFTHIFSGVLLQKSNGQHPVLLSWTVNLQHLNMLKLLRVDKRLRALLEYFKLGLPNK